MPGFFGDDGGVEQVDLLNRDQNKALKGYFNGGGIENNDLYKSGSSYLQNLLNGGPNAMAEFNAPYMQQFQQQIIPGLSERFAGMGTGAGALGSSAFNQTLSQAGSGLQSTLAALRQQIMGQAAQQGLQYAQQPYSNLFNALNVRSHENIYKPPTEGPGQGLLKGAAGAATGFLMGGPPGAMLGFGSGFAGGGGLSNMGFDTGNILASSSSVLG